VYSLLDSYIYGFALQEASLPFDRAEEGLAGIPALRHGCKVAPDRALRHVTAGRTAVPERPAHP
jgi:hypothetical protein